MVKRTDPECFITRRGLYLNKSFEYVFGNINWKDNIWKLILFKPLRHNQRSIILVIIMIFLQINCSVYRFGDMVALQKNNTLNNNLEYVAFTLIFILFGLAVVAASLDLLVLRFVTMNTEDERRDEAEALQVKKKTLLNYGENA